MDFLAETALLTHGLRSISNEELRSAWTVSRPCLAWVERGTLRVGTMEEYLPFRSRGEEVGRIDCEHLEDALKSGASGALTASGTMAACHRLGVFLAVSCGIGYEFVMLQYNQRFRDVRHVIQFAFYLFGINVLSAGPARH